MQVTKQMAQGVKWPNLGKVKQSHYSPGQALRVPGGWGSQISRQSAHEGDKVVSPTHRPPLPPRKHSWYSFLLEAESTPGPGFCQWKIPMTPSGIEPLTFRLVAQYLNQLRHRVPRPDNTRHSQQTNTHAQQAARLLRSWVRIPPGAWIFVCCECRVLSGRGFCDELITRPEESYWLCCVVVCDLETSRMGAPYTYIWHY